MATTLESVFLIFGGIILIGYLGELVSRRFSLPSALILLLIGFALKASGYADASALSGIQDIFGTLALVVLLFDGGLSLNLRSVIFKSGRVVLVGALTTFLAIIGCYLYFGYFLGVNPLIGAIFGALAGGIGSATTISIVRSLSLPKEIGDFLTMESSITDVFSIILTIVFTGALISGSLDLQFLGQSVMSRFSVGVMLGALFGLLSLAILSRIEKGYNYVVTFALMLMIYAFIELLGGSGAIGVLIFGIVFGNETEIRRVLNMGNGERNFTSRGVQAEISFFIRTFFLVFLGVVVNLGSVTNLLLAVGLMALLYVIRYAAIRVSLSGSAQGVYSGILTAMNPRGLATAVLATYPVIAVQNALAASGDARLSSVLSQLSSLPEITFYIIVLSVLLTSVLVPIMAAKHMGGENGEKKKNNGGKQRKPTSS
ncbi:MAG: cation:proton antiporter [Candidatus Micrarchaeota archaeon]